MEHPPRVLYLEHDGKVLLVDSEGNGPMKPKMNNTGNTKFRFPTEDEVQELGIEWEVKNTFDILGFEVIKAHPNVEWPKTGRGKMNALVMMQFIQLQENQFTGQFTDLCQRSWC